MLHRFGRQLRIAWFMPRYGDTTSYEVSKLMVPELSRRGHEIDLYGLTRSDGLPGRAAGQFLTAAKRHAAAPYDFFMYQLEDTPLALASRIHCGLIPGLVYAHDVLLTSETPEPLLNSPWADTVQRFTNSNHPWPKRDARHQSDGPFAHRELSLAALALFSDPWALSEFRRVVSTSIGGGASALVPLVVPERLFSAPLPQLGPELRIGFCGTPRIEGRAHVVLEALEKLPRPARLVWLIAPAEERAARQLCAEFPQVAVELMVGRSLSNWQVILDRIDIALHLRMGVFGHLGIFLPASLARGICSVVMNFAQGALLASDSVLKIEPGEAEAAQLRALFEHVGEHDCRVIGKCGRAYAREYHSLVAGTIEFEDLIYRHHAGLQRVLAGWSELLEEAKGDLFQELIHRDRTAAPWGPRWSFTRTARAGFQELGWL